MANRKYTAQKIKDRKTFDATGEDSKPIPASIWGQLEPLDKKAREKILIWGDTLPANVQPELAGMFRQAYENLGEDFVEFLFNTVLNYIKIKSNPVWYT